MSLEKMAGDLCTMVRVTAAEVVEVHKLFQKASLFGAAGLRKAPKLESLRADLDEDDLLLWHIIPEDEKAAVGYAGYVTYSGPPFIFVYFFNEIFDLDLSRDCFGQMVHAFFQNTSEESLYTYVPQPVPDNVHDLLLENGFDFVEEGIPGVDPKKEGVFRMERATYKAYHTDETDDELGLLDDPEKIDDE